MPIDPCEEAGLRAFERSVGAAGARASVVRPKWIDVAGVRQAVVSVDVEWREVERHGFRVRLHDEVIWLLYYVPELDLWSGIAVVDAVGGAPPA
jgi:hypothetical protein